MLWRRLPLIVLGLAAPACGGGDPPPPDADLGELCFAPLPAGDFEKELLLPTDVPAATGNVRVADLRGDGSVQILVAETQPPRVLWLENCAQGCTVTELTGDMRAPVRAHVADVDGDGARDLLVADVGEFFTTDDPVGRVHLLHNQGDFTFTPTVLLDGLRRVACAETGDLDGDTDLDIAVCEFGNIGGRVFWYEQAGATWVEHLIDPRPGAIHLFPFDADADDDVDLAAAISQLDEEVVLYRNDGTGQFAIEVLFRAGIRNFGTSGIHPVDLDGDGDTDLLHTNGDLFDGDWLEVEDLCGHYGVAWLENDGVGGFTRHHIIDYFAAFSIRPADFDGDDDLDLMVASLQDTDIAPPIEPAGILLLENDGSQRFTRRAALAGPATVVSIEVVDLEGDGDPDLLAGSIRSDGDRLALFRNVSE